MGIIKNKLTWKVAGAAGDGILNAGLHMFAKSCLRAGYNVFAVAEYPSLIRGGHNHLDVRVSDEDIFSHTRGIDLLIALNKDSVEKHENKINKNGGLIYDPESDAKPRRNDIKSFPIPLLKIANEHGGKIMRNTVAIGASFGLTGFDIGVLNSVIKDNFSKKGDEIVKKNIEAAAAGYEYAEKNFKDFPFRLSKVGERGKLFMSGNESIAAGAIKAGCKLLAAYPMTPATSVMTNVASQERAYSLVVKHTEDEIAAVNTAIGAGFAGVRAMTCTSGGGFALMAEGLGLAAQTETPLVIVEAQRPGPGTGMATHSSQGDLNFMLHASTDEFPRVVIAPGDVKDCFYFTIEAFEIAEKYQMPVIIMTDKFLGESYASSQGFDTGMKIKRVGFVSQKNLDALKDEYRRYKITESGVSQRSIPGQKDGMFTASSYEHDEEGFERESEENRIAMHKKRYRKFESLCKETRNPELVGDKKADITIIGWGSTKGPILEAMRILKNDKITTNYLQVKYISPLPEKMIADVMKNAKKTVIVENNMTSQLGGLIKQQTGLVFDYSILKYDGRPFFPEEIANEIINMCKKVEK